MKKIVLVFLALLLLALAIVYLYIPGKITISQTVKINASREALYRKLANGKTWGEWWPGETKSNDSTQPYSLNSISYTPEGSKTISIPVALSSNGLDASAELSLIPSGLDSTIINLEASIASSYNPFKRISTYFDSRKIKDGFVVILEAIGKKYISIPNLYGYDIQKKSVVDSTLIFTSAEVKGKPGNDMIYSLVDKLKTYIKQNDAKETGFPMLNVYTADSTNYLVKVAIPVDKKLPSSGTISYRWMLGGGNILITEVKGGQDKINKAYVQILNYISDYQRIAPAIPFESLVTDRRKETDSSKWITRIYYPVM